MSSERSSTIATLQGERTARPNETRWTVEGTAKSAGAQAPESGSQSLAARLVGHWTLVSFELVGDGRRQQRRFADLLGKLEWDTSFDYKAERTSRKRTR